MLCMVMGLILVVSIIMMSGQVAGLLSVTMIACVEWNVIIIVS